MTGGRQGGGGGAHQAGGDQQELSQGVTAKTATHTHAPNHHTHSHVEGVAHVCAVRTLPHLDAAVLPYGSCCEIQASEVHPLLLELLNGILHGLALLHPELHHVLRNRRVEGGLGDALGLHTFF